MLILGFRQYRRAPQTAISTGGSEQTRRATLPVRRSITDGRPVEVNKNGDMVAVYARSGSTVYPEARYSVYFGTANDINSSSLLQFGEVAGSTAGFGDPNCTRMDSKGNVFPCITRWGDNAGASLDPDRYFYLGRATVRLSNLVHVTLTQFGSARCTHRDLWFRVLVGVAGRLA